MTTQFRQTVSCGACGAKSEQIVIGSTNQFGSPDLDLRPPPMARHTIDHWLQECPHCGYVAASLSEVTELARTAMGGDEWSALASKPASLSARFLKRSLIEKHEGNIREAGEAALHAAWAADDSDDPAAARFCRATAASLLSEALDQDVADEDRMTMRARLVDILRRAEKWDEANKLCSGFNGLNNDTVQAVIEFQCRLIVTRDAACYTVADAIKATAPGDPHA